MKKGIMFLMAFVFISLASALTVGTILTQNQIDNADVGYMDLNPSFETKTNGNINITHCRTDADVCYASLIVATTVEPNMVNTKVPYQVESIDAESNPITETRYETVTTQEGYIVVEKEYEIPFRTTIYYNIANSEGRAAAWDALEKDLRQRAKSKLDDEIRRINSYKTQELLDKETEINAIIDGKTIGSLA